MKLTYAQLEIHIKQPLQPLYVVSGTEPFLKYEAIRLIRKKAQQEGFAERVKLNIQSHEDCEVLYTALHANSLFASTALIEIACEEQTYLQKIGPLLKDYITTPASHQVVLLHLASPDQRLAKNSWYGTLEKEAVVITAKPLTREQLVHWIMQRARRYQLNITPEAVQCLADYTDNHLASAAGAIEKIVLLKPASPVDVNLIKTVLTDDSRFTVFHFVEQLISGHLSETLHRLDQLLETTEPALILWSIVNELRLLAILKQELTKDNEQSVFQKHRIFSNREKKMRPFLKRHTLSACYQALLEATQIDSIIKQGELHDIRTALQRFCLKWATAA
jgi:DNA polymerase-3 subunit delta